MTQVLMQCAAIHVPTGELAASRQGYHMIRK